MGIDHSLDPNPELTKIRPARAHRAHGVLIREGATATRQLPSVPGFERTDAPMDDSISS